MEMEKKVTLLIEYKKEVHEKRRDILQNDTHKTGDKLWFANLVTG